MTGRSSDCLYPTGEAGVVARFLALRSGLRVRVVESGAAAAPPVVLLSGWACSAYLFRKTIPALAAAGLHPIAAELKGQGLSDKPVDPAEYTLESLAEHLVDVLDALALPRAALVGQSLGGAIATRMTIAHPDRVCRLALISPVGFGRVDAVRLVSWLPASARPLLPWLARRWVFAAALRAVYGSRIKPTARDVDEYFAQSGDPAFLGALLSLIHGIDWEPLTPDRLRRIQVPVLVIFGSEDPVIRPRTFERLAREVPDARTLLIPRAGHATPDEAPEETNRALVDFLRPSRRAG